MPLELCFKGARDYLHGTDVYTQVAAIAQAHLGPNVSRVKLALHSFFRHQPDVVWSPGLAPPRQPERAVVEFSAVAEEALSGWFVETDRPVTCRAPYDEEAIGACCRIEDECIFAEAPPPGTPIEVVVSMTKRLHQTRFPPAAEARWIFTRLDLKRLLLPEDPARVSLRLLGNLHGRITRSEIRSGGVPIGSIFFSLVGR